MKPQDQWTVRLLRLGRLLLRSVDPDEVVRGVAEGMAAVSGCSRCIVTDFDPESGWFTGRTGHGVDPNLVRLIMAHISEVPVARQVLAEQGPVVVDQPTSQNSVPQRYLDQFNARGSVMVVPLGSEALGTLGMAFLDRGGKTPFALTPDEWEVVGAFADLAALAIQNADLVQRSRELARLRERSRLAADLHDGISQALFAATLALDECLTIPELPGAARSLVGGAAGHVQASATQLHHALFELTTEGGDAGSLRDELKRLLEEFTARTGISGDLQISGKEHEPVGARRDLVIRVAREGLRNVEKHAGATEVEVRLRRGRTWCQLDVDDDGTGAAAAQKRRHRSRSHFGLATLADQTAQLGGRLHVTRAQRLGGFSLSVAVPLSQTRDDG
ncbi:MAG: GAF domain-containing sensor histidine kinase [Acidimicrobiia bacterium]